MSDPFDPANFAVSPDFDRDLRRQRIAQRASGFGYSDDAVKRLASTMAEDELLERVRVLCRDLGLLAYHTHDSRKSPPGYPDWHIVGRERSIFRELKTETGKLTKAQERWLGALSDTGHDADVWRPSDLLSGRIHRELAELARIEVRRKSSA